jgi:hypothetical protein
MAELELRLTTGGLVHTYASEGAAPAFVRNVVVFAGREAGAQFQLVRVDAGARTTVVTEGEALVRGVVEDRVM